VEIKNFTYMPRYFTVSPGTTMTVRNDDQVIHTLTADDKAFNTGNVTQGLPATFKHPCSRASTLSTAFITRM
jgi:plastocyanin